MGPSDSVLKMNRISELYRLIRGTKYHTAQHCSLNGLNDLNFEKHSNWNRSWRDYQYYSFPFHVLGGKKYPAGQKHALEKNLSYVPFVKSKICFTLRTVNENRRSEVV